MNHNENKRNISTKNLYLVQLGRYNIKKEGTKSIAEVLGMDMTKDGKYPLALVYCRSMSEFFPNEYFSKEDGIFYENIFTKARYRFAGDLEAQARNISLENGTLSYIELLYQHKGETVVCQISPVKTNLKYISKIEAEQMISNNNHFVIQTNVVPFVRKKSKNK